MLEAITKAEVKSINKVTEQIHVAVQYLAMAGKFLVKPKSDDSHTNMGWLPLKEKFISHPFGEDQKYFMILRPETMEIGFLDGHNHLLDTFSLKGKTQKEGTKWVKKNLKKFGFRSKYKIDLHYDLPPYSELGVNKFKRSPKKAHQAFSKLRDWADFFITKNKVDFPLAEENRTWPHHFDHAAYIPLVQTENGETTKSLSLGMAIHDDLINEPYFYVSAWDAGKVLDMKDMKQLSSGSWHNEGFKGATLALSAVLAKEAFTDQLNSIDLFFQESIKQLLLKIDYKVNSTNGK